MIGLPPGTPRVDAARENKSVHAVHTTCRELTQTMSAIPASRGMLRGLLPAVVLPAFVLLSGLEVPCMAEPPAREVTLWLMPIERAAATESTPEELAALEREYGPTESVTVVNYLPKNQGGLLDPNPDLGVTMDRMIRGHTNLLSLLKEFATDRRCHVNVRFLVWGKAYAEILTGLKSTQANTGARGDRPDVVQVGSTWVAALDSAGLVADAPDKADDFKWRDLPPQRKVSLRYTTDSRILFYYKRMPDWSNDVREIELNCNAWTNLIDSLRTNIVNRVPVNGHRLPPMLMPIGDTLNIIHDYAQLVYAGGGRFLSDTLLGPCMDLASPEALEVPLLLARNAVDNVSNIPLIQFPDKSHQDAAPLFFEGKYLATIELPLFVIEWREAFNRVPGRRFADYASAAALPVASFKGGSDLVVAKDSPVPDLAHGLVSFMADIQRKPDRFTRIAWHQLPAQTPQDLLIRLFAGPAGDGDLPTGFTKAMRDTGGGGRGVEYYPLATFPNTIEDPRMRWQFQQVWREMARHGGGAAGDAAVKEAARTLQKHINITVYPPMTLWNDWGLLVLGILLGLASAVSMAIAAINVHERRRTRCVNLALLVRRMQEHSGSVNTLANQVSNIVLRAQRCPDKRATLPDHIMKFTEDIRIHDRQQGELADAARKSVMTGENPTGIAEIAREAFSSARTQFLLAYPAWSHDGNPAPVLDINSSADKFRFTKPSILSLVLQEWFYNSIKAIPDAAQRETIRVLLKQRHAFFGLCTRWWLRIETPRAVKASELAKLSVSAMSWNNIVADVSQLRGLTLIRNVSYWGLTRTALRCFHLTPDGQELTELSESPAPDIKQVLEIPLPSGLMKEV